MTTGNDETLLRRYLLGDLTDDQSAEIEAAYLASPDMLERVRATEDELVDGYLTGGLSSQERDRFEGYYLAAPAHRVRVAVARDLHRVAAEERTTTVRADTWWPPAWQVAAAAALVVGILLLWRSPEPSIQTKESSPTAPGGAPAAPGRPEQARSPVVVAVSLSPATVRAASDAPTLVLPPGVDIVSVELEGATTDAPLEGGRVTVSTVSGEYVWGGPQTSDRATGVPVARVEIPASALKAEDYIVSLFGVGRDGREIERFRYFLRVRQP